MITEDFCSFDVAKLLKEKGFNKFSYYGWDEQLFDKEHPRNFSIGIDDKKRWISCHTHQMAMKWLRNEHNIMVSPYALSLGYYFEIFDLTTKDITGCKPLYKVGIPSKEDVLSTYEKAVEAACIYSLKNLI